MAAAACGARGAAEPGCPPPSAPPSDRGGGGVGSGRAGPGGCLPAACPPPGLRAGAGRGRPPPRRPSRRASPLSQRTVAAPIKARSPPSARSFHLGAVLWRAVKCAKFLISLARQPEAALAPRSLHGCSLRSHSTTSRSTPLKTTPTMSTMSCGRPCTPRSSPAWTGWGAWTSGTSTTTPRWVRASPEPAGSPRGRAGHGRAGPGRAGQGRSRPAAGGSRAAPSPPPPRYLRGPGEAAPSPPLPPPGLGGERPRIPFWGAPLRPMARGCPEQRPGPFPQPLPRPRSAFSEGTACDFPASPSFFPLFKVCPNCSET